MIFPNETEFVRWLRRQTSAHTQGVRLGIGDDAAVVRLAPGKELILTTDLSVEGVHFLPGLHPPDSVGHRALARALSDVAAMGGTPRFALISLALTQRTTRTWVEQFYAGLMGLAKQFAVNLVGGDTAIVPERVTIDVVVAGEISVAGALLRSGARPGDRIFVSGCLGLSALGLELLRSRAVGPSGRRPLRMAIDAQLYPQPRCALGRFLADRRLPSAAIDLSDGLSTDLGHLCESSGVGARIWESLIPVPKLPSRGRERSAAGTLDLGLHGGEDYQLLFTVPANRATRVPARFRGIRLQSIGEIRAKKGMVLVRADGSEEQLLPGGYDHFRQART